MGRTRRDPAAKWATSPASSAEFPDSFFDNVGNGSESSLGSGAVGVCRVSPALILILVVASAQPASLPPATATAAPTSAAPDAACQSRDAKDIVVCAQRSQPYRVDPAVNEAGRQLEAKSRSATVATPPAQAICATQPEGCGNSLASLDLLNVAIVAATAGVRAATGKDWTKAFKTGGPDEYQLYQEAKRRREAEDAERAAARFRAKARGAEPEAAATRGGSK
jgi:hypothetical protein